MAHRIWNRIIPTGWQTRARIIPPGWARSAPHAIGGFIPGRMGPRGMRGSRSGCKLGSQVTYSERKCNSDGIEMGIFSKKPPSPEATKAEEILASIQRERKPILDLGMAIASVAMQGGQAMRSKINAASEADKNEQFIYVCYEFIYF